MREHIDQEDRRLLQPIAQAMAQDFLQAQLKSIDAKIRSQQDYLERHYASEDKSRQGLEQMLRVYAQEKEIIGALLLDCQEEILPDAFNRRMLENERALAAARAVGRHATDSGSGYWQMRREAEILKDLLRRWNRQFRSPENKEREV